MTSVFLKKISAREVELNTLNAQAKRNPNALVDIPHEITSQIFQLLPRDALLALRKTCNTLKTQCDNLPKDFLYSVVFEARINMPILLSVFEQPDTIDYPSYRVLVTSIIHHYITRSTFDQLIGILLFARAHSVRLTFPGETPHCPLHHEQMDVGYTYRNEHGMHGGLAMLTKVTNPHDLSFIASNPHLHALIKMAFYDCYDYCPFNRLILWLDSDGRTTLGHIPYAPFTQCCCCGARLQCGNYRWKRVCTICHKSVCDGLISCCKKCICGATACKNCCPDKQPGSNVCTVCGEAFVVQT